MKLRHPARGPGRGTASRVVELGDLAIEHHRDAVGHDQRLFLVMGDQDEGDADLALQLDQFHLHLFAHLLVERRERLVQQQHLGLQDQRAGQRHALALPARQRMRRARFS
jgi:hypothetical protein